MKSVAFVLAMCCVTGAAACASSEDTPFGPPDLAPDSGGSFALGGVDSGSGGNPFAGGFPGNGGLAGSANGALGSGGRFGMATATSAGGANADCPAAPPADNSDCSVQGAECTYGAGSCGCRRGTWRCSDVGDAGSTGSGGGGAGVIDGGSGADCPATAPDDNSSCTAAGAECDYGDTSCGCYGGAWRC